MAKILLADDEDVLRGLLAGMLETDGHSVTMVADGNALLKAVTADFDLVITDLIMPEKEGIETIIALRKALPKMKVIAMSGGGRGGPKNYLQLALKLGAVGILEKPFDREKLLSVVQAALAV